MYFLFCLFTLIGSMVTLAPTTNLPLVPCRQCGKLFPDKQDAIKHSRKVHRKYKYCPNNCGYRALRKKNLRDHSKKCHLNGVPTSLEVLENLAKMGQTHGYQPYKPVCVAPQPPLLNTEHDPMWSPLPEEENFISEEAFEPVYPELNEVTIESKPAPKASTSMARLAEKRDNVEGLCVELPPRRVLLEKIIYGLC